MAEKVLMLALSPTMDAGTISKWVKREGEKIENGTVLCEVETDKATMDYESANEGELLKILVPEGGRAKVGDPIAILGSKGEDISGLIGPAPAPKEEKPIAKEEKAAPPSSAPTPKAASSEEGKLPGGVMATPLARRLAQEKGIDLRSIAGSGPRGRIVKEDVEKAAAGGLKPRPTVVPQASVGDQVIPVSEKRRIIAQRMTESVQQAPHYFVKMHVHVDPLLSARKRYNAEKSTKLSLNAFLMKLVAEAIKRHPVINSSWAGDKIIQHGSIDIALAVAQPDGLIAPIVRNCGNKGITDIDTELKPLIERGQKGQLSPEEYKNPTFTISNLGSFGVAEFTAIINQPAVAILAVGETRKQPVVDENDQIVVRSMMTITLSSDHRVVDGANAAAFLKELKDIIEDPMRALL